MFKYLSLSGKRKKGLCATLGPNIRYSLYRGRSGTMHSRLYNVVSPAIQCPFRCRIANRNYDLFFSVHVSMFEKISVMMSAHDEANLVF